MLPNLTVVFILLFLLLLHVLISNRLAIRLTAEYKFIKKRHPEHTFLSNLTLIARHSLLYNSSCYVSIVLNVSRVPTFSLTEQLIDIIRHHH